MKATKLALALGATFFTLSSNAATVYDKNGSTLDIYGKTEAVFINSAASRSGSAHSSYNGEKATADNTIASIVRFGMAGSTKINDHAYAIGVFEWETPIGDGSESKALRGRYQYVGINAQSYGTITAGRGDSAYTAVAATTDIFDYLDHKSNDYWMMGDTKSGQIMYSLSAMGWDVRVSAQLAEDNVGNLFNVDSGFAFSVATRLQNGISFAYGASYTDFSYEGDSSSQEKFFGEMYARADRIDADATEYGKLHHPSYKVNKGIAISYGTLGHGFYTAALFNVTRYKGLPHHIYDYELVASYGFDNGINIKGGWSCQQFRSSDLIEDLTLGISYSPAPSFKLYAETQIDISSHPDELYPEYYISEKALGQNRFVIGAAYYF